MNLYDIHYFAGLIDGEGTITLTKQHSNESRVPVISVASTTFELVEFCKTLFGGIIANKKTYQEHHKKSYSWSITHDRAINVCRQIAPYLKEPEKQRRVNLILDHYKSVTPRNGKYTPEMREAKMLFEQIFFQNSSVVKS